MLRARPCLLRLIPVLFLAGMLITPAQAYQQIYLTGGSSSNINSVTNSYLRVIVGYDDSNNNLTISNSAHVLNSGELAIGDVTASSNSSSNNSVLVTGSSSLLSNSSFAYVGFATVDNNPNGNSINNRLTITNGGEVIDPNGYVGYLSVLQNVSASASSNSALVTGSGSLWSNSSSMSVGYFTTSEYVTGAASGNSLSISNGGEVVDTTGSIGYGSRSSNNSVQVTGSGSLWSNSSTLTLSASSSTGNTLTVADGGRVVATSLNLSANLQAGTLNIGSLGGSDTAGTLGLGSSEITITGSTSSYPGTFNFNQSDTFTLSNAISSGYGVINQLGSGTTILSASNACSGTTTVANGTLLAGNSVGSAVGSSTVLVTNAGTLGGNGLIGGVTTIASGGKLVPGVSGVGVLSFTNALTLGTASKTSFIINATNNFTSINLIGNTLTYGGALDFNITSYTAKTGDVFTVFNLTGGATETEDFSSVEAVDGEQGVAFTENNGIWSGTNDGFLYQFSDSSGVLSVIGVPEPTAYALIGIGVLILVVAYRRRPH